MPSFKPKATKKIGNNTKNNVTVDSKHHEKRKSLNRQSLPFYLSLLKRKIKLNKS